MNCLQPKKKNEKAAETEILDYLNKKPDWFAWKTQSLGIFDPTTKRYRSKRGFDIKGVADISALRQGGYAYFFEVKDDTGKQSDSQKAFERKVKSMGAKYYVVRSVEDAERAINGGD